MRVFSIQLAIAATSWRRRTAVLAKQLTRRRRTLKKVTTTIRYPLLLDSGRSRSTLSSNNTRVATIKHPVIRDSETERPSAVIVGVVGHVVVGGR